MTENTAPATRPAYVDDNGYHRDDPSNPNRAAQVSAQLGEAIDRTTPPLGPEVADELAASLIAAAIRNGRRIVVTSDPAEMSDLEELDDLADTALTNWEMAASQRNIRREELQMAKVRLERAEHDVERAALEYDRACQARDTARRADEGDPQMRAAAAQSVYLVEGIPACGVLVNGGRCGRAPGHGPEHPHIPTCEGGC
jgi:hypothetical protein